MSEAKQQPKIVLITGVTSGIGFTTAEHLHEMGYKLLLVGRDEQKLISVSEQLGKEAYYICDLEHTDQIEGIFSFCKKNNIKLDGMVHSAGYAVNMPIRIFKAADMERQMRIHYYAFLELCRFFSNKKYSNDGASIIAMSSLASLTARKGSVLYASSKNALNAAVKVASKEFIKRSIRVNALLPAYVDTRMNTGLEDLVNVAERQPMGLIPPKNIAYVIEFLLSEKSKYITGALIPVSAGMEE